jgi:hypothetical protein
MRPTILSLAGSARRSASTIDNQQSSNPITPSRSSIQQRNPLQPRDGNVMMRAPQKGAPLSTRSGNAMPPQEKQNGASRPVVPTLGASSTKTASKTPLTPRVAGSTPSLASSPLTRKAARQEGNTTPTLPQRDEFSTPLSSFLNTNITPRSSSRKTRVDSANTTPSNTPTGTPAPDVLRLGSNGGTYGGGALNVSGLHSDATKRPTVSFSPAVSDLGTQKDHPQSGGDTKFFYASDAKAAVQPKQQLPTHDNKISSFFYANGDKIPPPLSSGGSTVGSVTGSVLGEDRSQPKFFHANGTPDLSSQQAQHISATSSTVSNSHFTAPRLAPRSPRKALSPLQRPPSPLKANHSVSSTQLKHGATLPSPVLARSNAGQDALLAKSRGAETTRRSSGHERSASAGVLDLSPSARRVSNSAATVLPSPSFPSNITTAGLVSTPDELLSESGNDGGSSQSEIHSPVKAGHSLERMNELAANARRERKVLDLEITNSSLAAINRTLEREMRKQTAELRRYRRLSRSGRLSINTTASIRTSSGTFSTTDGVLLSDMSEDESDADEEEETSEEEFIDEGSLSPGAMAENDAWHREKDEKRLLLDISKHQQLLIDSQNMNQSLKRCLGWTEELINEGKKALAYHVRVSDIELGGRVLAPDEIEDSDSESFLGLDCGTIDQLTAKITNPGSLEVDMDEDLANRKDVCSGISHHSEETSLRLPLGVTGSVSVEISPGLKMESLSGTV